MRLWSLHPAYLDRRALVAVWREGLLARAVLRGQTRGYRSHPQLFRFRDHPAPKSAINHYLREIAAEAERREYRFDKSLLGPIRNKTGLTVTDGQLRFELNHLRDKIRMRSPSECYRLPSPGALAAHPIFTVTSGDVEAWEKGRRKPTT